MEIKLGNHASELAAVIDSIADDLKHFQTRDEKIGFIHFMLKNHPFGVVEAMHGFKKTIVTNTEIIQHFKI